MSYTTKKVFDVNRPLDEKLGEKAFEGMAGLMEFNNAHNDSYHKWTVDAPDGNGGGYMTAAEQSLVDTWLKKKGAVSGESILIYYWW